jgi:hypothetical protein
MVLDLIGLVFVGLLAIALIQFVPRPASRTWAVGLLVFAVIGNLGALVGATAAYFFPLSLYLDTEKHQLQFNRGEKGEVVGVMVNNPPPECRFFRNETPWSLTAGNLALAAVILVFLRRAPSGMTSPGPQAESQSGSP